MKEESKIIEKSLMERKKPGEKIEVKLEAIPATARAVVNMTNLFVPKPKDSALGKQQLDDVKGSARGKVAFSNALGFMKAMHTEEKRNISDVKLVVSATVSGSPAANAA